MCFTPRQAEAQRKLAEKDAAPRHEDERPQPAKNTKPRGNGEVDRADLERGEEKFGVLIGH